MPVYYRIVGADTLPIWGLSQAQRTGRVLTKLLQDEKEKPEIWPEDPGSSIDSAGVLLLRADYLVDERVIAGLVKGGEINRVVEKNGVPIVAWVAPGQVKAAEKLLSGGQQSEGSVLTREPLENMGAAVLRKLRKVSPPFALLVTRDTVRQVEHHLFNEAYKGITDLVTKWVWPRPAEQVVRFCVRYGIRPNHVTAMSWILAIVAGILFYRGFLWPGLLLGWIMTFLDTVDGKLARVTVDSSPFGHLFDHVLDLIHPPLWYLAWGLGLSHYQPLLLKLPVMQAFWLLLAAYVGGRVVEAVFKKFVAGFSIFTWRPVDSINRLITARRNPCLILLTFGLIADRPDLGFEAVTLWTIFSTLFLLLRLGEAVYRKKAGSPLQSWLDRIDPKRARGVERWFITPAGEGQAD